MLLHYPSNIMATMKHRLVFQTSTLNRAMGSRLGDRKMALALLEKRLQDLSPLSVLGRGYSITRTLPRKRIIRDVSRVKPGDAVEVLLGKGHLECRIEKVGQDEEKKG